MIKVPASSANMGAGFDTLGIGVCLFSTVEMSETETGLTIIDNDETGCVPKDEKNLIYRAAKNVFDEVGYKPEGLFIKQLSDIPMTRGLGSSSACIISGMLGANVISGRKLSYSDILDMAADMEGHPDNVAPALYGGLCISAVNNGRVYTKSIKPDRRFKLAVFVPDYFVSTRRSRGSVPSLYRREDAVFNISHASLMVAAFAEGNKELMRAACDDKIHQPYRKNYIEGYDFIFKTSYELGAAAVYLSGSGPTIVAIIDENYNEFKKEAQKRIDEKGYRIKCEILSIDNVGTVVKEF